MSEFFVGDLWRQSLSRSVERFGGALSQLIPSLAGALLILIIGWGVSRIAQAIARRTLRGVGLDRMALRLKVTENLNRLGVRAELSAIVARILFWLIMLTFVYAATRSLGLDAATSIIDRLIAYLPRLLGAALIVVVGLILGQIFQRITVSGASVAGLSQAEELGGAAYSVVVLVAAVVAIEQLGLKTDVLITVITILIAVLSLTIGLAFALGARSLVAHILAGHYLRQSLSDGRLIEVAGHKGTVQSIGAVNTVLRHGETSLIIPNAMILEDVVTQEKENRP